ncbi:hypothetical protein [Psychrobacillus phage Perkons]|nr:hypothetical protein [Psychrobacillus phage Perkons]
MEAVFKADGIRKRNTMFIPTLYDKVEQYIEEFAMLIDDKELRGAFYDEVYIAGGFIYSIINNESGEFKDIDLFFKTEETALQIKEYFRKNSRLHMSHSEDVKIGMYGSYNIVITSNALSVGYFQVITRWTGTPEEVVSQFDFKHNMFFYQRGNFYSLVDSKYLYDDYLHYNDERARDICGTIMRVSKFVSRGMKITQKEVAKMLLRLNDVGFNDRELEILNNANRVNNGFES